MERFSCTLSCQLICLWRIRKEITIVCFGSIESQEGEVVKQNKYISDNSLIEFYSLETELIKQFLDVCEHFL